MEFRDQSKFGGKMELKSEDDGDAGKAEGSEKDVGKEL